MSTSKPEAGQWWVANEAKPGYTAVSVAVRIEHILPNENIVVETYPNKFFVWTHANAWHHEPRCTGWDWVVPADPTPPANQPDPDEWVVQDRVPVRIGDHCWWVSNDDPLPNRPSEMWVAHQYSLTVDRKNRHGDKSCGNHVLHVMCRRRDLPPVEQQQWPKYWTTFDTDTWAFVKQISQDECQCVFKDGTHGPVVGFNHDHAKDRKQLTEAEAMALLKKPEPMPAKTPSQDIIMPVSLTAENGAKAALIDEFFEEVEVDNKDYCGCGTCDYCIRNRLEDIQPTVKIKVPVSWTTIKKIYEAAVNSVGKKPEPAEPERASDDDPQPAKTRVRLWMTPEGRPYFAPFQASKHDDEIRVDAEGFYVIQASH